MHGRLGARKTTVDGAHTRQGAVEGQPLLALLARLRAAVYGGYDSTLQTALPAKVLVLMHHKEYLNAGDDASSPCSLQANPHATPTPTPTPTLTPTPQSQPQPQPNLTLSSPCPLQSAPSSMSSVAVGTWPVFRSGLGLGLGLRSGLGFECLSYLAMPSRCFSPGEG